MAAPGAAAFEPDGALDIGGHFKYRFVRTWLPDDSLLRDLAGPFADDHGADARLSLAWRRDGWELQADYQLVAVHADTLSLAGALPRGPRPAGLPGDARRWWDLTHVIEDDPPRALLHRFDRLSVGYTTARSTWRFGRQAISWGNGLIYTPMDIFNPFDPAAVDKEFKPGDDMLYAQFLGARGDDVQVVAVVRRDPLTGDVETDEGSLAAKYHGFAGATGFDLLAARHFDETVLGAGFNRDVAGAVVSGDLTWADTAEGGVFSAVAGLSWAWSLGGHNVTSLAELYYNGFGQGDGDYAPATLAANPRLLERVARGELYTLGRRYAAASATVELTPLTRLAPTVFVNLDDPSALAQLTLTHDWRQDLLLIASVNLPLGPSGSEFGGIPSPAPGRTLGTGPGVFFQLARYF